MPPVHRVSRFGFVNAYLVEEDDGLTLVDTMLPRSAGPILKAAGGRPIKRIALTHAHGDHVGSLDALAEQLPGVEVLISGRDARLLAKDMTLDPGEPEDKLRGSYPGTKTRPTRTVEAGERIGSLEVVASPGHTPGHVAFLDTRDRTLYCGDTYSTLGGVATTAKLEPALPAARARHLAPPDRARERPGPARARPGAPGARPRQGRRVARRRDGRGDRPRRLTAAMPRQGLDRARVVAAAAALADAEGLDAVTLARVAADLGVRPPSLYVHVAGLGALRREIALLGLRELAAAMRAAAVGRSRADALAEVARAYRAYAHAHPGRYAATVRAPDTERHGAGRGRRRGGRGARGRAARLGAQGHGRDPRRARDPRGAPRLRRGRARGRLRAGDERRRVLRAARRDARRRARSEPERVEQRAVDDRGRGQRLGRGDLPIAASAATAEASTASCSATWTAPGTAKAAFGATNAPHTTAMAIGAPAPSSTFVSAVSPVCTPHQASAPSAASSSRKRTVRRRAPTTVISRCRGLCIEGIIL